MRAVTVAIDWRFMLAVAIPATVIVAYARPLEDRK
jgi:hypothetical protein